MDAWKSKCHSTEGEYFSILWNLSYFLIMWLGVWHVTGGQALGKMQLSLHVFFSKLILCFYKLVICVGFSVFVFCSLVDWLEHPSVETISVDLKFGRRHWSLYTGSWLCPKLHWRKRSRVGPRRASISLQKSCFIAYLEET